MSQPHDLPMEEYRRAGLEITRGNPNVYKALWSRQNDVTLANPFGPPVRGWDDVSARLDPAASNYRDGQDYRFENISTVLTPELAYTVEIERIRTRVGGADEFTRIAIRATTVFRREDGEWKVTHRHGDPITTMQPAESVLSR
jgi:ketosteroid isomerase-like protein